MQEDILRSAQEYVEFESHEGFRQEVVDLLNAATAEAEGELRERFYTRLSFGTGGIRGRMGGGFNRINPLLIQQTSLGLARYILSRNVSAPSVAIAYDSRSNSPLFADCAAQVLTAAGIKVYLFSSLRPTPELSFAIRELGCTSGIVCTASHNPPAYNGYKVYWQDGAQIVAPEDEGIVAQVRAVQGRPELMDLDAAVQAGLLVYIDKEIDEKYVGMLTRLTIRRELFPQPPDAQAPDAQTPSTNQGSTRSRENTDAPRRQNLNIVYTPLHGTGGYIMQKACSALGLTLNIVPEQAEPDGNFPTVASPNPEEASALELALKLAKHSNADLVIGTDPDADRIGIAVQHEGDYRLINGNEHGVLLTDYMFSALHEKNALPERPAFVNTIVSTELQRRIAAKYGAECFETLTGFKWIAAKIREFEGTGGPTYILGGEESYGFMIGTTVRDKDSISASLLSIEMALYHKSRGKTLVDRLAEIHQEFGLYKESLQSRVFEGENGVSIMQSIMTRLRNTPPSDIAGIPVARIRDIQDDTILDCASSKRTAGLGLPSSNVLQFLLADGSVLSARPSGTEPKIKFYTSVKADVNGNALQEHSAEGQGTRAGSAADLRAAHEEVDSKIRGIEAFIRSLIEYAST